MSKLEKLINRLPHYWYRGDFVLTYDHTADKWCAGYGDYVSDKSLTAYSGNTPTEAVEGLYDYLKKEGKIT